MKNQKKQQTQTDIAENNLTEVLNEHPYVQWIANHTKELIIGFFLVIALLFFATKMISGFGGKAYNDYIKANNDFFTVAISAKKGIDPETTKQTIENLETLMKKHPELQAKYDGLLAQSLINQGNSKQAAKYVNGALDRSAKKEIPLYADFAESTLLIEQNEYAKALDHSLSLKNKILENEDSNHETLFTLNLIRIALLEQKAGTAENELNAWNQWKLYAGMTDTPSEYLISQSTLNRTEHLFEEGKVNLNNYIEHRIKELQNKS